MNFTHIHIHTHTKACDKACLDDCTGPGPESCEDCGSGYVAEGDGEEVMCRDKNECTEDGSMCKEGTYCFNTPGSYKCNGGLTTFDLHSICTCAHTHMYTHTCSM